MFTSPQQARRDLLEQRLVTELNGTVDGAQTATELFAIADLLGQHASLLHALTDPGRSPSDRESLMADVVRGRVTDVTARVLSGAVGLDWSCPKRLPSEVNRLGILALLYTAKAEGDLETVGKQLYGLLDLLSDHRDLRLQLSDLGSGGTDRQLELLRSLIGAHVLPLTAQLAERAVELSPHGTLLRRLREYAREAARLEGAELVTVSSAQPLSAKQQDRLRNIIARRLGQPVILALAIDPEVVGGFRLTYGHQATDASVQAELAQARTAMAH